MARTKRAPCTLHHAPRITSCFLAPNHSAAEELIYGLDDMSTMHQMRITDARRIVQARLGPGSCECWMHPSATGAETADGVPPPSFVCLCCSLWQYGICLCGRCWCSNFAVNERHAGATCLTSATPHPLYLPNRRSWWSVPP